MATMVADRRAMTSGKRARIVSLVALALAVTASPGDATARDMTGKGGIGVMHSLDSDLLRPPAFAFRYWRTDLAIEMLVAVDWQARRWPADDLRETQGGIGVLIRLIDQPG